MKFYIPHVVRMVAGGQHVARSEGPPTYVDKIFLFWTGVNFFRKQIVGFHETPRHSANII